MTLLFSIRGISQNTQPSTNNIMETINASGTDATGSSGTVTYSIGQLFYTYIGLSVYNVAQGVQHGESSVFLSTAENTVESKMEMLIFPNPTTDFVTLHMEALEYENGPQSYQLYDLQGRLLLQNTIKKTETQINLNNLNASVYILRVYANNKVLKTFKILKK